MNPLDVANSGSMPISGGDAKSGNGPQRYDGKVSFGGINHKDGINPWILAGVGVVGLVAFLVLKRA